jgi:DNA polymerase V
MKKVFALVDCNNFYVSCERLFRPELNGKPVVVLSNNGGCIVARSNEAKLLGIPIGAPLFQFKALIARHNVHVFSSNYALYGDLDGINNAPIDQRVSFLRPNKRRFNYPR